MFNYTDQSLQDCMHPLLIYSKILNLSEFIFSFSLEIVKSSCVEVNYSLTLVPTIKNIFFHIKPICYSKTYSNTWVLVEIKLVYQLPQIIVGPLVIYNLFSRPIQFINFIHAHTIIKISLDLNFTTRINFSWAIGGSTHLSSLSVKCNQTVGLHLKRLIIPSLGNKLRSSCIAWLPIH